MKKKDGKPQAYGSPGRRDRVILKIEKAINDALMHYEEPIRKGTAKGRPIGFPLKKMKAAWWMVLYPNCLTLKEIARRVGVSEGVMRVWCHREDFVQQWEEASRGNGEQIVRQIKGALYEELIEEFKAVPKTADDWARRKGDEGVLLLKSRLTTKKRERLKAEGTKFIEIDDSPDRWSKDYAGKAVHEFMEDLPWFNEKVQKPIIKMLEEHAHIPNFLHMQYTLAETRYYWEDVSDYRVRKREIKLLPVTKTAIEKTIDMLTDPRGRKRLGEKSYAEMASVLKKAINNVFDALAK